MSYRMVICDDDTNYLYIMEKYCKKEFEYIKIVATAQSSEELLEISKNKKFKYLNFAIMKCWKKSSLYISIMKE